MLWLFFIFYPCANSDTYFCRSGGQRVSRKGAVFGRFLVLTQQSKSNRWLCVCTHTRVCSGWLGPELAAVYIFYLNLSWGSRSRLDLPACLSVCLSVCLCICLQGDICVLCCLWFADLGKNTCTLVIFWRSQTFVVFFNCSNKSCCLSCLLYIHHCPSVHCICYEENCYVSLQWNSSEYRSTSIGSQCLPVRGQMWPRCLFFFCLCYWLKHVIVLSCVFVLHTCGLHISVVGKYTTQCVRMPLAPTRHEGLHPLGRGSPQRHGWFIREPQTIHTSDRSSSITISVAPPGDPRCMRDALVFHAPPLLPHSCHSS